MKIEQGVLVNAVAFIVAMAPWSLISRRAGRGGDTVKVCTCWRCRRALAKSSIGRRIGPWMPGSAVS